MEFKETKNSRNFASLWSNISPSGNIYRYLGIASERLQHCWDLQQQLKVVADTHKAFQGQTKTSSQQRMKTLVTALKDTVAEGGFDDEKGEEQVKGFMPLEEFFKGRVECKGGINYPQDPSDRARWFVNHFLAFIVFCIQTVGVLCLFVQVWYADENQLRDPKKLWTTVTDINEIFCLGPKKDPTAPLTTLTGTLFLLLIYSIVYSYCQDETENAEKSSRLPLSNFWSCLGTFANAFCAIFIAIAIPLEFWTETGTQGIMMNAMALLFVFTLDDLTGDAFGYLSTDDSQFQQEVAWNYALLAYCPINIENLIDPNTTDVDKLWKIKYDTHGSLLAVDGTVCPTRIKDTPAPETETSQLVKKKADEDDIEDLVVEYCTGPSGSTMQLPGWRADLLKFTWTMTSWAILVVWCVVPVVWFIVNKPCKDSPQEG